MEITAHAASAIEAAREAASTFNRKWGGALLRVHPDQAPLVHESSLTDLEAEASRGWFTAHEVFARMFTGHAPTHGQLIRLGRQLSARYHRRMLGPRSYYWVAPSDVPPTAW